MKAYKHRNKSLVLGGLVFIMLILAACTTLDQPGIVIEQDAVQAELTDVTDQSYLIAPSTIGVVDAENVLLTATSLEDLDFQNIDGEVTGEIENVILDLASGNVEFVTVEYGGFLDIGDTEVAMPLNAFIWGLDQDLILNFDELELESFPDMDTDFWMDATDPTWANELDAFWSRIGVTPGFNYTADSALVRAEDVIDYGVGDVGQGASNVDEMLINLSESRVEYVLLDYGTTVGFDGNLVAVPYSVFNPTNLAAGELVFRSGIDAAVLEQAPRFPRDAYFTPDPQIYSDIGTYWADLGYDTAIVVEQDVVTEEADQAVTPQTEAAQEMGANTVEVSLTEYEIDMPNSIPAGMTIFEITNNGAAPHNLVLRNEETGTVHVFEQNLNPGETMSMTVDLQPVDYLVYCPVGGHAQQGMQLTLTVTP